MRRLPAIAINLVLLVGTIILFLALLEIGLRVTGIEKGRVVPPPIYRASEYPDVSYELKPDMREAAFRSTVTTNSQGFRSPEIDPGKPTLAVLGDSMTFGYGVEDHETLPARLGELLPDYNVVNGAVPGYTIGQERATYEHKIRPLHPAALILVFYWNDLHDFDAAVVGNDGNLYAPGSEPSAGPTCNPIREGILNLVPGKCWLDTHSAIYRTVKKVVSRRTEKRNQAQQEADFKRDPFYENVPEVSIARYQEELDRLAALLPPEMPRLFVIWPERPLHFLLRPRLKAMVEQRGFRVLDLYEVFGNDAETLSWDTTHPSAKTLSDAAHIIHDLLVHYDMMNKR